MRLAAIEAGVATRGFAAAAGGQHRFPLADGEQVEEHSTAAWLNTHQDRPSH
jgi:hypothetical protein